MIKLKHFPIYPEQFLRRKSVEVKTAKEADELKAKLIEMFPDKVAFAVAAVQIGFLKRATLIKFPSNNKDPKAEPVYTFMCNPVIEKWDDPKIFKGEGCLSYPKKHKDTIRFNTVTVRYQDVLMGELDEKALMLEGVEAVIAQHEVDHMDGMIFLDRVKKTQPIMSTKVGRNVHCPCGSGKKFKKCCIDE